MLNPPHNDVVPPSRSRTRRLSAPRLGTPSAKVREQVHNIWDKLADFDAAQVDDALTFLLESLCALAGAQNADWMGVLRLSEAQPKDLAAGWRPSVVHFLHPTEKLLASFRSRTQKLGFDASNELAIRMVSLQGRFRACRLRDLAPEGWFETSAFRENYQECGNDDAVYVAFPVNEDVESYFGIFRSRGQPPFTPKERDVLAYALRGLKWFHRQLLLSHGLLVAETPLTAVERRVVAQLLTGLSEKQIAIGLEQSYHTTHEYVTNIYRKFGVNNRAALMALWLGRAS